MIHFFEQNVYAKVSLVILQYFNRNIFGLPLIGKHEHVLLKNTDNLESNSSYQKKKIASNWNTNMNIFSASSENNSSFSDKNRCKGESGYHSVSFSEQIMQQQ